MNYAVTCPEAIRAEWRKAYTANVWEQEEWKQKAAMYCATFPKCTFCGSPTEVPHHTEIDDYGKPTYTDLTDTIPVCNICHDGIHARKFQCPICKKLRATVDGERCYVCLSAEEKERIVWIRERRTRERNNRNRLARLRYKQL